MSKANKLRLGTRGSKLAMWQANWVAAQLAEQGVGCELVRITTAGDVKSGSIGTFGGQGVFTKEIQRALLDREIDLAVHSLKDLPTEPTAGLQLAAVPPRESVADVLITRDSVGLWALPQAARVGTGSTRRRAQLLHTRRDLLVADLRGNVDTRLRKLDEGQYDAILLAEAGLRRLGLGERITEVLALETMLPAVGQGALGIETRRDDSSALHLLAPLDDEPTHAAVRAERAMLAALRAGCLAPVGGWARVEEGVLNLQGVVLSDDGQRRLTAQAGGSPDAPELLGERVARQLLEQGAAELIAAAREKR